MNLVPAFETDSARVSLRQWFGQVVLTAARRARRGKFPSTPSNHYRIRRIRLRAGATTARQVRKRVYNFADDAWTLHSDRHFLYDGWNLIRETIENQQSKIENHFVWGLDLSQTLQGAGGIGGLLSITQSGAGVSPATHLPTFDANGNVSEYLSDTGTVAAHYEYDAFGRTIAPTDGSLAETFPHRFSTKYLDQETALYYYGYRYYSPELGRWVNRDPIGERGGLNRYVMCSNRCLNRTDSIGLASIDWGRPGIDWGGSDGGSRPIRGIDLILLDPIYSLPWIDENLTPDDKTIFLCQRELIPSTAMDHLIFPIANAKIQAPTAPPVVLSTEPFMPQ